ncbi:hypothetical protein TSAR_002939 [Trichomalopsis sarcophagae]|uniref:MORN repeat-containing protein 5 n=1 Tax=Trichomalopsis sarcophagae TaxID=543379 RepID=A0A232FNR9_9HYME|nr:hypothetical protein TSAR_002939 [Trichomalopsis sarcophagae]
MSKKSGKTSKLKNKGNKTATVPKILEDVIRRGEGKFSFANGDSYVGEYVIVNDTEIYRDGYGVYKTSDQDEYRAVWDRDRVASNLRIVYSNGAEYNGDLDENEAMSGEGSYVFPDGTVLRAKWQDNVPVADYSYRDPLGHVWLGETSQRNEQEVVLKPANLVRREEKLLP